MMPPMSQPDHLNVRHIPVQPGPVAHVVAEVMVNGRRQIAVRLEGTSGDFVAFFTPEDAHKFADTVRASALGLTVITHDVPPEGGAA